jgi:hypothetical protein
MIKTATAVHIYMGNTTTTNVKRKDERSDDGKKKGVTREKEEKKLRPCKIFLRGKRKFENAARLKRDEHLFKNHSPLSLFCSCP